MATLGQQLKAAREAKGVSESEAGSAIKTLTRLIVGMEADDFSLMPAPTYAKGFIRLYAKYLGLDPVPLVAEYLKTHHTGPQPLIDETSQLEQNSRPNTPFSHRFKKIQISLPRFALPCKVGDLFARVSHTAGKGWNALPGGIWKDIRVLAGAVAALIILIIISSSISTCMRRRTANTPAPTSQAAPARRLLDEPIPDLYLVAPGTFETK